MNEDSSVFRYFIQINFFSPHPEVILCESSEITQMSNISRCEKLIASSGCNSNHSPNFYFCTPPRQLFILSPLWTQGPGNWGTLRDRNAVIFGTDKTEMTSQLHRASTHSHVWIRWDAYKDSAATGTQLGRVRNPSQQCSLSIKFKSSVHHIKRFWQTIFGGTLTCHSSPGIRLK